MIIQKKIISGNNEKRVICNQDGLYISQQHLKEFPGYTELKFEFFLNRTHSGLFTNLAAFFVLHGHTKYVISDIGFEAITIQNSKIDDDLIDHLKKTSLYFATHTRSVIEWIKEDKEKCPKGGEVDTAENDPVLAEFKKRPITLFVQYFCDTHREEIN